MCVHTELKQQHRPEQTISKNFLTLTSLIYGKGIKFVVHQKSTYTTPIQLSHDLTFLYRKWSHSVYIVYTRVENNNHNLSNFHASAFLQITCYCLLVNKFAILGPFSFIFKHAHLVDRYLFIKLVYL